jgi:hypothetical protein
MLLDRTGVAGTFALAALVAAGVQFVLQRASRPRIV